MTQAVAHILEEVEQLSESERTEFRHAIIDRLPLTDEIQPQIEESWKQETRRRLAELESGQVEAVPGDVVSRRIRKIVGR
jgi:putative addiction module component (TIGR02574 family)